VNGSLSRILRLYSWQMRRAGMSLHHVMTEWEAYYGYKVS
jgi:hypothetical protein